MAKRSAPLSRDLVIARERLRSAVEGEQLPAVQNALDDVVQAIVRESALSDELSRRAGFLVEQVGPGSAYERERAKVRAHSGGKPGRLGSSISSLRSLWSKHPPGSLLEVKEERKAADTLLEDDNLGSSPLRAAIAGFRNACWQIEQLGGGDEVDGCFWLEQWSHEPSPQALRVMLKTKIGSATWDSLLAAVDSLLDWQARQLHRRGKPRSAAAGSPPPKSTARPAKNRLTPSESRDRWIYCQAKAGTPYKKIVRELAQKARARGWTAIATVPGLRKAARRHASANGITPVASRQPGRRKK